MTDPAMADLLRAEQADVDIRYARLDELRAETARALTQLRSSGTAGTPAARVEREAFLALNAQNQQRLAAVEERLCIGRLAMADGSDRYVGRIGLTDREGVRLLLDWRAPAAQPFYRATPAAPDGVVSRRHLSTTRPHGHRHLRRGARPGRRLRRRAPRRLAGGAPLLAP